ncbi:brain-specific angiogenesis inhibitor 1-associated protein 2-like isoform X2 [Cololabis saira]|uniref:brain-specific angiogenesis inhibitor 1-associated protein 2-like isoform X2 n=1 Tax=Cololabis saira TaxID=129043 RepID=UPI002AD1EF2A|nr:brain-specific angiogenesis inhibitor 1-associated protein 2-like isoform X2 [Cololabis saira]
MVLIQPPSKMSRTDEVHRITENVYKSIMEQFNPCLRNFIAMAKNYEKAINRDVLFQMAEVHRQIQIQLEEMLKSFHNELLTELEKKVELDARYLNAALRKYQMDHKGKGESLDKCQAELKKLRRRSRHGSKHGDKEVQYVEANVGGKQSDLSSCIAEGYKNALSEERRRYCFLVDRQGAKNSSGYHGKELLPQKMWPQACVDPARLPDHALFLAQQMSGAASILPHHFPKPGSGSKPLPGPLDLVAIRAGGAMGQQRLMGAVEGGMPVIDGGEDYQQWAEKKSAQAKASPPSQRYGSEGFSNTLPVRKAAPAKSKSSLKETRTLPRSSSMAAGLERNARVRVRALFSHAAGDNSTLLSFAEGDVVTLLVPEARDGWHYGESEKTRMRGWFPFSYTRLISESRRDMRLGVHNLHHGKSSSTGNLLDRDDGSFPVSDYVLHHHMVALHGGGGGGVGVGGHRPYGTAAPAFSQSGGEEYEQHFLTSSTDGKLISTV